MIQERKYCQRCCKMISDINNADYYSHIRIKYFKECAAEIHREQAAIFAKEKRRKIKENNKLSRLLNNKLMQENELLKRQLEQARERIEILNRG